jgi:hypothetical protein
MAVRAIRTRGHTPDRKKILEASPFFWLATRDATSSGLTWILILFLTLLWGCFFISSIGWKSRDAFMLCLCTTYAMHQVSKLMFGIEATRQLSEARRNGNLELLLVSPLEERKIIEEQEQALKVHFSGVQRYIILINLLMCAGALIFPEELSMSHEDQGMFLELFLGGILMLLLDFRALGAVGMLMALRIPRQNRAILASFARVLCIPWAAIFLLVFLGIGGGLNGMRPGVVFAIWFGIGVVTDLAAGSAARALLARGMRECQETKLPILANPRAPAPAMGLAYPDF